MSERKGRDNMKAWFVTAVVGGVLTATTVFAQTPPKPAAPAPKPATPAPTQPAAAAPQPPRPFPEGAKIAYVDVQQIASESSEGKSARTKIEELSNKKTQELQAKQKAIQ